MEKKINVLVVPSDTYGVGWYRSTSPHNKLAQLYGEEFNVEYNYQPDWTNFEYLLKFDIIHVHKGLFQNMEVFWNALDFCKVNKIVTIIDVDDNWDVGKQHPLYLTIKAMKADEKIKENFRKADFVTTTTEIFADRIRPYNPNVYVFPNAIDPEEEQYKPIKENTSDRIKFGFIMGSSHEKDMEQFKGVINSLGKDIVDKIQVVLCGYDLRGTVTIMDKDNKKVGERDIKPEESVWYTYEKNVTDEYRITSPAYTNFLKQYLQNAQWPMVDNEPYRREWTKDVSNFATHYRNIDVLLAPLDTNDFNMVKSELKFAEAGFTHTALICSDFGPYNLVGKSMIEKGGVINEEGNCLLIDPTKKHKQWAQYIKKLVNNPEMITKLQDNLSNFAHENYDLNKWTNKRAEWYKSILKK